MKAAAELDDDGQLTHFYLSGSAPWAKNPPTRQRAFILSDTDWAEADLFHAAAELANLKRLRRLPDEATKWLDQFIAFQLPSGNFIATIPADNAELTWYHELVILHGLMLAGAFVGLPAVDAAIHRAALFHLNETQPDHATHHPWALAAFVRHPECRPMAESMLHAMTSHFPNGLDVLSRILLADALWLLEREERVIPWQ